MKHTYTFLFSLVFLSFACQKEYDQAEAENPEYLHRSVYALNEIIIHDIFSPPVASRIYAYSSLAGYEAGRHADSSTQSLAGQVRWLTQLPQPEAGQEYCFPLAGVHAFLTVGRALTFSEDLMDEFRENLYKELKKKSGISKDVFERSIAYGTAVGLAVMEHTKTDNYKETRTFPKFTVDESNPARWQPTPPDYKDAAEPHWSKIRPFVLDSAGQFLPPPPPPFDTAKGSLFRQKVDEVYHALDVTNRAEREEIAYFWDDNPFVSHHAGHVMFADKKVTPGGHWMNIAMLASRMEKADFVKSSEAYLYTAIGLLEGFISCWHGKYFYNLVRPETYINKYMDQDWRPFLQTPAFPEHTSGHSVISRAASEGLTYLYGDNFAFNDTTNVEYGRTARKFGSFIEASNEASISRLYGGIHFLPALRMGEQQGRMVGELIRARIVTRRKE
ncbi:MAG: vanadium-dependent haloperoxidase [Haliscomenobacter sp.]|nr:vanadium-dependent haloperoxidase [Haliscomenobacter sp.]MBK9489849.1 vanadium-dependent haloperoxidase [Haliscomenobacter sp.]